MPPLIPAAKLRPVGPRITVRPPVMYSHAWSPAPSATAVAPELRTQKRSATMPRMKTVPLVAPYSATLPAAKAGTSLRGALALAIARLRI
jgi:hypothetical protein